MEVSNLGAKITKLITPPLPSPQGREIKPVDVVLGFKTAEEWCTKETYFNAICGRVANRTKDGVFELRDPNGEPRVYHLPINNGPNSLHGGIEGFNAKIWEVVEQSV